MIAQVTPVSFIHSFSKYLLNMPGTVIGVGVTVVNKMGKKFCLHGADILVSTKQALTRGICYFILRGIDVCWHLLAALVLQSVMWRPIILKKLKILVS